MKKSQLILIFFAVFLLGIISSTSSQKSGSNSSLEKLWETGSVFKVPESVCYDPAEKVLYISSINGNATDKDNNGFISKCSMEGNVLELNWANGLNAPKGMGICNGRLYVADIDRVAEINLSDGQIVQYHDIPGSSFLNDIAVSPGGIVFISDMGDQKIYTIADSKISLWLDDPLLTGPNGLDVAGDELLIGCKKIVKVPVSGGKPVEWLTGTGSIDGLEATGDGRILFSDWKGNISLVTAQEKILKLLDLTTEQKNAADIEYIPSDHLLLVPTFGANTVVAYRLVN